MTFESKFSLGEKVKVPMLETDGRIKSIWIIETGIQYEVRYFANGEAKKEYFFEDELTPWQ